MGQQIEQRPFRVQEFRGYALNFAARLDASVPHTILRLIQARSHLSRQVFFAAAAEIDLVRPEAFLAQIEVRAADVLADFHGLGPDARIARALAMMTPRTTIECVFGTCPDGLLGLFERFGSQPLYGPETYRLAFELFSRPEHRRRAKVLRQLPGQIRPEHITVIASLDDVLVHRAVLERVRRDEVRALNSFARMIVDLCGATPELVRESLDRLPLGGTGVRMTEWAEGWLARQVRLPFDPPVPADDPDLRLRLGADLDSLGRRLRNCAANRKSYSFLGERLIYEVIGCGEPAVLELLRLTSAGEAKWVCEDLRGPRNRRVNPELAAMVQSKLDQHGILYQSVTRLSDEEQALHKLLDHTTAFAWDMRREAAVDVHGDDDIQRMLEELGQDAA
ncbi:MAG: hypothetical protein ABS35_20975 [Kaistia sp. SCN 65-12]|nr:MAG: hypothetical protein ABS35_20975 [Kaistia sp. SCN 65-12]